MKNDFKRLQKDIEREMRQRMSKTSKLMTVSMEMLEFWVCRGFKIIEYWFQNNFQASESPERARSESMHEQIVRTTEELLVFMQAKGASPETLEIIAAKQLSPEVLRAISAAEDADEILRDELLISDRLVRISILCEIKRQIEQETKQGDLERFDPTRARLAKCPELPKPTSKQK